LRGLEIKDDTYAFLKIVRSDGSEIKLIDSSSPDGTSTQYSNFILQSVSEARMEKHQIVETFGEPYIYFFGESPRFLDVSAVLVDSLDFNWYAEFWENYNKFFRGTRSVELGARTYLFYDDNVVEGYVLMAQAQKVSEQPLQARLTFRMYLTNYTNVTFVGDPNYPVRASVSLPAGVNLTTADAFSVGQMAVKAETDAALQENINLLTAAGVRQQEAGFGGGQKLTDAIRGGIVSTGDPFFDGFLQNAREAVDADGRTMPLRGLIADNWDEFTSLVPPRDDGELDPVDTDGEPEAEDFPTKATGKAKKHGANMNSPNLFARLGIGARFTASAGFGVRGSAGLGASFGVGGGSSFGAGFRGGINGGLGFTGGFTASVGLRASAGFGVGARANATFSAREEFRAGTSQQAAFNVTRQFGAGFNAGFFGSAIPNTLRQFGRVYGNGVLINGGVIQGTGVGGGIPGGVSGGIGPDGPGTLTQFTGGRGFQPVNGFGSSQGYGNGLSANGAALNVGGAPSAFSTVVAPGQLNVAGSITESFNIGPNGVSSSENKTGIFA
jgi:hypothetical protein